MGKLFHNTIKAWHRDESGATAIEYGLLCAGIALALVLVVFSFGEDVNGLFEDLAEYFDT